MAGSQAEVSEPGPHRLQNPAIPSETPQRCGPITVSNVASESVAAALAHIRKTRPLSKMKNDKIVAIGLKRLKTVLCHCGITDGEWPLQKALRKRNRDRHKPADRKRGMKC